MQKPRLNFSEILESLGKVNAEGNVVKIKLPLNVKAGELPPNVKAEIQKAGQRIKPLSGDVAEISASDVKKAEEYSSRLIKGKKIVPNISKEIKKKQEAMDVLKARYEECSHKTPSSMVKLNPETGEYQIEGLPYTGVIKKKGTSARSGKYTTVKDGRITGTLTYVDYSQNPHFSPIFNETSLVRYNPDGTKHSITIKGNDFYENVKETAEGTTRVVLNPYSKTNQESITFHPKIAPTVKA